MSPWPKRARRPWTTAGWHGRAAIPQQHARRPNRRPSTPNPVPPRSGKRRVGRLRIGGNPACRRRATLEVPARATGSYAGTTASGSFATQRRCAGAKKSTPCFGRWLDQSVRVPQTRSPADAPKRFDLLNPGTLPPRKEHADTSESPFRLGTSNRIRTGWLGCLVGHPRAVVRRAVWRTVRQP